MGEGIKLKFTKRWIAQFAKQRITSVLSRYIDRKLKAQSLINKVSVPLYD